MLVSGAVIGKPQQPWPLDLSKAASSVVPSVLKRLLYSRGGTREAGNKRTGTLRMLD